jgi:hypothetical protein
MAPPPEQEPAVEPWLDVPHRRWLARLHDPAATYALTRFWILRLLGLVYFVAFYSGLRQIGVLVGPNGLYPAPLFLERMAIVHGGASAAAARLPSLFWLTGASDAALEGVCAIGAGLALAVLFGATNAFVQLALWILYTSVVNVGQLFYGYGWEMQLLETGFLSIFLCPLATVRPLPARAPPATVVWLFRWLIVRVMWGAGLIKLRGDPCWTDLTCLAFHYETQPNPNPLSALLHHAPLWFHKAGTLVNHAVEVVAPLLVFAGRRPRAVAGVAFVAFQAVLIASGNLSFLNWLTIVPALALFDDAAFGALLPAWRRAGIIANATGAPSQRHVRAGRAVAVLVGVLSIAPVANLVSSRQVMNTSFEPLHLVNTYGAFGVVGRERSEIVLAGTRDLAPDDRADWREYELPCKPGDVRRRPCVVTPYHYRLDWQIWFAAMSTYDDEPWLVHLVYKLLRGDAALRRHFAVDPFPDAPPRWIRADLYRYELTRGAERSDAWWRRTYVGPYMRPLRAEDPDLRDFLRANGWRR